MSEPICWALCCRGAGCLISVRTHLPGTVLQGCRLFKWCQNLPTLHCKQGCRLFKQCLNLHAGTVLLGCRLFKRCRNLPAGHCVAGVQAVKAVSEFTCQALCCRGEGCLSNVGTYLWGTVCRLFKRCINLPTGHCVQGCKLFKWCRNLPARQGVAVAQAAEAVSEPTCQALCCRGAGCFSGVRTYLLGTMLQECRLFKWC